MEGTDFDEDAFFRGIASCGAGALAIPALDDLIATKRFMARNKDLRGHPAAGSSQDRGAVSRPYPAVTDELRARMAAMAEEPIDPAQWRARAAIPISDEEREETLALVRWFCRRYPTADDRLAYVRRAYRRWTNLQAGSGKPHG